MNYQASHVFALLVASGSVAPGVTAAVSVGKCRLENITMNVSDNTAHTGQYPLDLLSLSSM